MKNPNRCIAKRLKEARLACGISQRSLGMLAGIHENSASARMNQYERGTHLPKLSTLQNIGKVLGYPAAFFVSDDDVMSELIYLVGQLAEDGKQKLLSLIKNLVSRACEIKPSAI